MRKLLISVLILSLGMLIPYADAGKKPKEADPKEALQELQDFIGGWKGTANDKKLGFWTEKSDWSWRFKGKDVWMSFKLPGQQQTLQGRRSSLSPRQVEIPNDPRRQGRQEDRL